MFTKILISNRGEIARRIIRTCKKMQITAVAVYSEADRHAPFVGEADEAYLLGSPKPAESYLNIDKIIEIAKECKAEAIHPGYGFLSENAAFAERCGKEGIVFIGPSPEVIRKMGKKIEARLEMERAGLKVVPGKSARLAGLEDAVHQASLIGYPVMLKASAGGGGIGMGALYSEEELIKAYEGHQSRAESFFSDSDMYLEKLIENARHIEIQVLADSFGNVIHLGDRECSVQRRNQKVIEEAPSPALDAASREEAGQAAVLAARQIGYRNAGTFEFLLGEDGGLYFLEMNTRLQVEHAVTEEVTGIDLVEQQIKIAAGHPLSYAQSEVWMTGHSMEARIYAEDPLTFFPSPGTITSLQLPDSPDLRHDIGVVEGNTISPFYDGMFAKLIVKAESREVCIRLMRESLKQYKVEGIKTNIPMLLEVIGHEEFRKGNLSTQFVTEFYTRKDG